MFGNMNEQFVHKRMNGLRDYIKQVVVAANASQLHLVEKFVERPGTQVGRRRNPAAVCTFPG